MSKDLTAALAGTAEQVAQRLLGCELVRTWDNQQAVVRIVETEAYDQTDAASHSYKGRTPRTDIMFGPAGYLYVYFTYGMHYCCNVVVGMEGEGAAVLIRAVEPVVNKALLEQHRRFTGLQLTNGPAKLCQALQIDKTLNGHDLSRSPLELRLNPPLKETQIVQTTRIGISQAKEVSWRFYIRDNLFVSKIAQ